MNNSPTTAPSQAARESESARPRRRTARAAVAAYRPHWERAPKARPAAAKPTTRQKTPSSFGCTKIPTGRPRRERPETRLQFMPLRHDGQRERNPDGDKGREDATNMVDREQTVTTTSATTRPESSEPACFSACVWFPALGNEGKRPEGESQERP